MIGPECVGRGERDGDGAAGVVGGGAGRVAGTWPAGVAVTGSPGVVTTVDGADDDAAAGDAVPDGVGLVDVDTAAGAPSLPLPPELLLSAAIAEPPPTSTTSAAAAPTITPIRRGRLGGPTGAEPM